MKEPITQPIPARRGRPKKDAPLVPVSVRLPADLAAELAAGGDIRQSIRAALIEWREWKRSGLKSGPF